MNTKRFPLGVRLLLGLLSVVLCILLFVSTFVGILLTDLRVLTSKNSIQQLVTQILFTSAPARPIHTPGGITLNGSGLFLSDGPSIPDGFTLPSDVTIPEDFTVPDHDSIAESAGVSDLVIGAIYDMIADSMGGEIPISKEQVETLVQDSSLPDFVSEKVADVVSSVITGDAFSGVAKEEIIELVTENKELIEQTFEIEIAEEQITQVGQWVEENKIAETVETEIRNVLGLPPLPKPDSTPNPDGNPDNEGTNTTITPDSTQPTTPDGVAVLTQILSGDVSNMGIPQILALIRFFVSDTVLLSLAAVCLALTGLLFLTKWGRPWAALRSSGITYMVAGGLYLIPTALTAFAPDLFAALGIAGVVVKSLLSIAAIVPILVFGFGLLLVVVSIVLHVLLKKRAAKLEASAPEAIAEEIAAEEIAAEE